VPLAAALDASAGRLYVVNSFDDSLSVIDTATNQLLATVPAGRKPWDVTLSDDGSLVYVADSGSSEVRVLPAKDIGR
jgi:YVTN family beta-propeller protein